MKKLYPLIFSVCFFCFSASANHIVGGEIEFITLTPGLYRINLIQYFDKAQITNPGPEPDVTVYIYSNKDHKKVSEHTLLLRGETNVEYTNMACVIDELKTSRVLFSQDFSLDPLAYTDPEGYYIVWERCCRNANIVNIVNPLGSGMKYVTEIPPLSVGGAPFINSSPVLLRPLSDYACVGQYYYAAFTGTDPDGDSLSYRMTTSLNSSSGNASPIPQPKPHIKILFKDGYSEDRQVPGNPPLSISNSGLLTVTPSDTGLFVFSVLVEEWRHGVRIGAVQRDFQMLVVDGCEPPDPPEVGVRIPGQDTFDPETDTLKYGNTDDKCFDFYVTNVSEGENIRFRAFPVGFDADLAGFFAFDATGVLPGQDTIWVQACAPDCPPAGNKPFAVDLVAMDDACPLPQQDTLRLTFRVEPPPNSFPVVAPGDQAVTVQEDDLYTLNITGTDADNDEMEMRLVVKGVANPADHGFFLDVTQDEPGKIAGTLHWNTDCQSFDFAEVQRFEVGVIIDDHDTCGYVNPNVLWLDMQVVLPPDAKPAVTASGATNWSVTPGEEIAFEVEVTDPDHDPVSLILAGSGFDPPELGVSFAEASGTGTAVSAFAWKVDCEAVVASGKDQFTFYFIGDDEDKCKVKNLDTLAVEVMVNHAENNAPRFQTGSAYQLEVNQPFELVVEAFDADNDTVMLELFEPQRLPDSRSLVFHPARGKGSVSSVLQWTPECSLLGPGGTSELYELIFLAYDDACPFPGLDTVKVSFELTETREKFDGFEPPNVFTPNDDGVNDVFTLTNLAQPRMNLPPDHCNDVFRYISIHDRNGTTVFRSESREFAWDGGGFAAGTYFYVIRYSTTVYKGYLQLLK